LTQSDLTNVADGSNDILVGDVGTDTCYISDSKSSCEA
jgi:hypothetical protein